MHLSTTRSNNVSIMKKFTHFALATALFTVIGFSCSNAFAGEKVTICHIPPGNPDNAHTITVSKSALPAHMAHGDIIGECSSSESADAGAAAAPQAGATFVICDNREGETGRTISISLAGRLQTNRSACD
jgi:hypothetical protein